MALRPQPLTRYHADLRKGVYVSFSNQMTHCPGVDRNRSMKNQWKGPLVIMYGSDARGFSPLQRSKRIRGTSALWSALRPLGRTTWRCANMSHPGLGWAGLGEKAEEGISDVGGSWAVWQSDPWSIATDNRDSLIDFKCGFVLGFLQLRCLISKDSLKTRETREVRQTLRDQRKWKIVLLFGQL